MQHLRNAAARERRAPILWWFLMTLTMGGVICLFIWHHSHDVAVFTAILLAAAWMAPLLAFMSLAAPHRAKVPPPARGEGTYDEWMKQARLLGRVLLYYGDNPDIPGELRHAFHDARMDLHDTLKAHPLRDDLERVCQRIRDGAIKEMKNWFAGEYRRDIRELADEYEQAASAGMDPDKRLLALQDAVEKSAALMSHNCMPRMLARERLVCANKCSWLAVQAVTLQGTSVSPVDLAEMLVIEWSDFSRPWQPARALQCSLSRLAVPPSAPELEIDPGGTSAEAPAAPLTVNGKTYRRVRVRVRKGHRHRPRQRHSQWRSVGDTLISFGQWIRYSIRSWMLYR